jgi:L-threonylcarbamoyladenylate synthase
VPEVFEAGAAGSLAATAEALARGELAVIPTDTVYGLAARPDFPEATARIFEAKRRPRDLTLPVLVPDLEAAVEVATLDGRARSLARGFWPGGLTVVLPRSARSWGWDLGSEAGTVAVRVPDHPVALDLLRRTGPLAVTSANRSGEPPAGGCEEAREALGDDVAVYLCAGRLPGTASTVVALTEEPPRVLRIGAIPPEAVFGSLSSG